MKRIDKKYRNFRSLLRWFFVGLVMFFNHSNAAIYKTIDQYGNTHFSDTPQKNATVITLKPINHYAAISPGGTQTTEKSSKDNKSGYKKFAITKPKDQQTLQNTNEINVELQLQPALKSGDSIEFLLDGHTLPLSTETSFVLNEIERGEHKLQARLLNSKKKVLLMTPVITVYVHQVSTV